MEEILHQLIGSLSVYPMIYTVSYMLGGAGCLPSTVSSLSLGKSYSCICFSRSFFCERLESTKSKQLHV